MGYETLIPLISITHHKKVQSNMILVKQGEPCKYIYFIKSGIFKVLRQIEFLKKPPQSDSIETHYQSPSPVDHTAGNVKSLLLEIGILGRFSSFGDMDISDDHVSEPYTVVSAIPSEIFILEREKFVKLLG